MGVQWEGDLGLQRGLGLLELLLEGDKGAVLQLGGAVQVVVALRVLDLQVYPVHLALDALQVLHLLPLALPGLSQLLHAPRRRPSPVRLHSLPR